MRTTHLYPTGRPIGARHSGAWRAVDGIAGRIGGTIRLWLRRRRQRRELLRLDDRMLRDIGLTRGDAEFLINKPFWRE